jgi:hypothetical protein
MDSRIQYLLAMARHLRAVTVAVSLFCALASCHGIDKRSIVRLEVFEDHVSVDGVLSDLPIQQVVDAQTQSRKVYVLFIARQPLSAARLEELTRAIDKAYPSSGIGIRRVQLPCPTTPGSTCR